MLKHEVITPPALSLKIFAFQISWGSVDGERIIVLFPSGCNWDLDFGWMLVIRGPNELVLYPYSGLLCVSLTNCQPFPYLSLSIQATTMSMPCDRSWNDTTSCDLTFFKTCMITAKFEQMAFDQKHKAYFHRDAVLPV